MSERVGGAYSFCRRDLAVQFNDENAACDSRTAKIRQKRHVCQSLCLTEGHWKMLWGTWKVAVNSQRLCKRLISRRHSV